MAPMGTYMLNVPQNCRLDKKKRAGITQKDLVSVYVSMVRPVIEYACPIWHTNLPQYLFDNTEVIKRH